MSEPSKWEEPVPNGQWERRKAGRFDLWARDNGRFEIYCEGELFKRDDTGADLATAKASAEEALRKLLTDALGELGGEHA